MPTLTFLTDRRLPPPGSVLTRADKGWTRHVRVFAQGFETDGLVYPSLSAVVSCQIRWPVAAYPQWRM